MDEWREVNRANWDERVPIHVASAFYDVEGWIRDRPARPEWERDVLGDLSGLDVVHLQCHIGLDTLALAEAGATVTGLDFSPAAIAQARLLARRAELEDRARFVEADVLDAAMVLAPARFDVVFVSLGALCWLPHVARWAEQVGALLRKAAASTSTRATPSLERSHRTSSMWSTATSRRRSRSPTPPASPTRTRRFGWPTRRRTSGTTRWARS
jgi:SAM-dependent methyltransferase